MSTHTTAPVRPFLDWPAVTDPASWDAPILLVGLPQSEPYARDTHPNDQTRAPGAIRLQSRQICDGPAQWDFDLGGPLGTLLPPAIDGGDMPWTEGNYGDHAGRVTENLAGAWRRGAQIAVLGGDHGVTIPVLDALKAIGEPVHVVQIDAHLDWREEVGGVTRGYSSPLRWASRLPWIAGLTQIGLRGTGSARRGEVEAAIAYGSKLITAQDVHRDGMEAALAAVPANRPIYVTIDADGL
ncbi:MAG TPA: arginase family protein, partial [Stellaceae bacterium]|nr:arginase family protein [Stellaceae bacterium]